MTDILQIQDLQIGSWWAMADGGNFGYTILSKDELTGDVKVLGTDGNERLIDWFKLQYRYYQVVPNDGRDIKKEVEEMIKNIKNE